MARLVVDGLGVAVLPTALMRSEIDKGQIRLLNTTPAILPSTMAIAHNGPAHRYRMLMRLIVAALQEGGLMEPL